MTKTSLRLAGAAVLLASTALAPAAMAGDAAANFIDKGFPLDLKGTLDGMQVYTLSPDDNTVWYRLPDGTVIAGYAFDREGHDLNAKILGDEPMDVWESVGLQAPGAKAAAEPSDAGAADLAKTIQSALDALPDGPSDPKPASTASVGAQSKAAMDATMAQTSKTIAALPDEKKRQELLDLVAQIKAATNPADFQLRVIEWNERVSGKTLITDAERAALKATAAKMSAAQPAAANPAATGADSSAATAKPAITPEDSSAETPAQPGAAKVVPLPSFNPASVIGTGGAKLIKASAEVVSDPPQSLRQLATHPLEDPRDQLKALQTAQAKTDPSSAASQSEKDAQTAKLYADIESNGFTFTYGAQGAPVVYVFADPLCPHCANAFGSLAPAVEAGEIQLKVLPVPVISKNSPAALATVMLSDDPAKTFWTHEMDYARSGRPSLELSDFSKVPQAENDALHTNYSMVGDYGLPGVPFFAWKSGDSIKLFAGEPGAEQIAAFKKANR